MGDRDNQGRAPKPNSEPALLGNTATDSLDDAADLDDPGDPDDPDDPDDLDYLNDFD
jgi:hypothetical protein